MFTCVCVKIVKRRGHEFRQDRGDIRSEKGRQKSNGCASLCACLSF